MPANKTSKLELKNGSKEFASINEFYPFYLSEHTNRTNRRLHFIGSNLVLLVTSFLLFTAQYTRLWVVPFIGYGFAWVGHFFFEKNKPATFKHPLYSFVCDWVMCFQIWTGKIKF
eukprot:TRINITY_DN2042_c0_g3_i1.p1 TRINITY_DN2042_c0_g3~~TRINITY_DN2042_c0_g3_i1.p1  ORF type:complete len:115 (-),score=16.41 TRINITY_DN2042_c0_g3_i1:235-579(-)